jgi:hypothetical protein
MSAVSFSLRLYASPMVAPPQAGLPELHPQNGSPKFFWALPRTKKQISPRMNTDDTNLQSNGLMTFLIRVNQWYQC